MTWVRRIEIPFMKELSKNYFYGDGDGGHLARRQNAIKARAEVGEMIKAALKGVQFARNKVWIDLLVQKPDQRIDAVNLLDQLFDSIKVAIGHDDRWFCIHRLDWQVVKRDPRVFIGIGQKTAEDVCICSHCGRLLAFDRFWKNKSSRNGVTTACKDCMRGTIRPRSAPPVQEPSTDGPAAKQASLFGDPS